MAQRVAGNAVEKTYPTLIAFNAGGATPFSLDVTRIIETLQFQLTGTLTNAGYTTAPVKRVESLENLIRSLEIEGVSKGTGLQADKFTAVDAAYLVYQTRCLETTAPDRVDVGTANAVYNFRSTWNKYFGLKRHSGAGEYQAGFLDSRFLSTLTATLNFRDVTAVIDPTTGVAGTSVLSNVNVAVHSIEWSGAPKGIRNLYLKQSQRSFDLTNLSGLNQPFLNAPVGSFMPRQTFKTTVGNTAYSDPTNSVLTTTLQAKGAFLRTNQNGDFDWLNISAAHLQSKMKTDYSVESLPAGYYTQEYSRTRDLAGDIDLRAAQNLTNFIDLTTTAGSTNTLQITDERVIYRGA